MQCPFAQWSPVASQWGHPTMSPNTLIFHSVAGSAQSAVNYFSSGSTNLGSHFILFPDGHLVQQVDTAREAYANVEANGYAISCETGNVRPDGATDAGFAVDLWTDQQIATMVKLAQWCHDTHGVALRVPPSAAAGGVGYHNEFPEWSVINGGGTACPGAARVDQFHSTVLPAIINGTPTPTEDPMADAKAEIIAWIAALAKQNQDATNIITTGLAQVAHAVGVAQAACKPPVVVLAGSDGKSWLSLGGTVRRQLVNKADIDLWTFLTGQNGQAVVKIDAANVSQWGIPIG